MEEQKFSRKFSSLAENNLALLRDKKPLVHNITNYVVMNYTAMALLAIGASPIMAHAHEEVEELTSIAGALVLNIGTLSPYWIDSMIKAGKKANMCNIPVILDPVGSGASKLRTNSVKKILKEVKLSVIRGNASEILSLIDDKSTTKGVDSIHSVEDMDEVAKNLAEKLQTVVAITGKTDLISDGKTVIRVKNGHPMMSLVTGTGCTASALIAAFNAVNPDSLYAAAEGLAFFGLAGERTAKEAKAPGSFQMKLLDNLYTIDNEAFKKGINIYFE